MSLETIYLESGGTRHSLADWGITAATLTTTDAGEDELVVEVPCEIDGAQIFPAFGKIELFSSADGITFDRRFVGWRITAPRRAEPGQTGDTFTIAGPQCRLDAITFQHEAQFPTDESVYDLNAIAPLPIAEVIINRNALDGSKLGIKAQIDAFLDYAILEGAPIDFNTSDVPTITPPESQDTDITCWEGIRGQMRWWPAGGARWDYSGSDDPTLVFLAIATGTGSAPGGATVRTLACSGEAEALRIDSRDDLLVASFAIQWLREVEVEEAGTGKRIKWHVPTTETSTAANGSFRRHTMTSRLRGAVFDGTGFGEVEPVPAAGLAAEMHKPFRTLQYQASWSTAGNAFNWGHQPGDVWNFSGGRAAWATAHTPCRTITRDLAAGVTTYQTGPRDHLGLNDLLALRQPNRLRKRPDKGVAGGQQYGFEAVDDPDTEGTTEYITVQRVVTGETTVELKKMKVRTVDEGAYTGTEVRAMVQNGALAPSAITITTADPITPDP